MFGYLLRLLLYQQIISVTGFQIFMFFSTASISRCNIFSFHLLFHILVSNFVMIHFNKYYFITMQLI